MAISLAIVNGFAGGGISAAPPIVCVVTDDVCIPDQPEQSCIAGAYLNAAFLYWRASEEGIGSCGPLRSEEVNGAVISLLKTKGNDPNFSWAGGYRIAAGFEFTDTWAAAGYWTHYRNHDNRHHIQCSHLRWKLDYDTLDLVLGYNWTPNTCFNVKAFFGLRGAEIDQKILICADHGTLVPVSRTKRISKQDFEGLGPVLGFKANWGMTCAFSFYASAACSVLYGNYHVKLTNLKQLKDGVSVSCGKRRLHACTTVADLAFGIQYEKCCFDKSRFIMALGVEHHQYFNFNRMNNYGDLCLDGGTLSAGLIF